MITFSPYALAVVAWCSGAAHAVVSSAREVDSFLDLGKSVVDAVTAGVDEAGIDSAAQTAQQSIDGGIGTGTSGGLGYDWGGLNGTFDSDPTDPVLGTIKGGISGAISGGEQGYDWGGIFDGAMAGVTAGAVAGGIAGNEEGWDAGGAAGTGAGAIVNADEAFDHHVDAAVEWIEDAAGDLHENLTEGWDNLTNASLDNWTAGWNNVIGIFAGTTTTTTTRPPTIFERIVCAIRDVVGGIKGKRGSSRTRSGTRTPRKRTGSEQTLAKGAIRASPMP